MKYIFSDLRADLHIKSHTLKMMKSRVAASILCVLEVTRHPFTGALSLFVVGTARRVIRSTVGCGFSLQPFAFSGVWRRKEAGEPRGNHRMMVTCLFPYPISDCKGWHLKMLLKLCLWIILPHRSLCEIQFCEQRPMWKWREQRSWSGVARNSWLSSLGPASAVWLEGSDIALNTALLCFSSDIIAVVLCKVTISFKWSNIFS